MFYLAVIPGLLVGFLTGLFAFRVKARWCPACGNDTIELAHRVHRPASPATQPNPAEPGRRREPPVYRVLSSSMSARSA